jgi:hypothetical protein
MRTLQGEIVIEKSGYAVLAGVIGMAAASSPSGLSPNVGFTLGFAITYVTLIALEVLAQKINDKKANVELISAIARASYSEATSTLLQSLRDKRQEILKAQLRKLSEKQSYSERLLDEEMLEVLQLLVRQEVTRTLDELIEITEKDEEGGVAAFLERFKGRTLPLHHVLKRLHIELAEEEYLRQHKVSRPGATAKTDPLDLTGDRE